MRNEMNIKAPLSPALVLMINLPINIEYKPDNIENWYILFNVKIVWIVQTHWRRTKKLIRILHKGYEFRMRTINFHQIENDFFAEKKLSSWKVRI